MNSIDRSLNNLPASIKQIEDIQRWVRMNPSFTHMDHVPPYLKSEFEESLNDVIEEYLKTRKHCIDQDNLEILSELVAFRDGEKEVSIDSRDGARKIDDVDVRPEGCIYHAINLGMERITRYCLGELRSHAEGADPATKNDRGLMARHKTWQDMGPINNAIIQEVQQIQQALRWMHGEGIHDWKQYYSHPPELIAEEVKKGLENALIAHKYVGDERAIRIQWLLDGHDYDHRDLPEEVAVPTLFSNRYLPELEEKLIAQLEERGFILPSQEVEKSSSRAPSQYSMER